MSGMNYSPEFSDLVHRMQGLVALIAHEGIRINTTANEANAASIQCIVDEFNTYTRPEESVFARKVCPALVEIIDTIWDSMTMKQLCIAPGCQQSMLHIVSQLGKPAACASQKHEQVILKLVRAVYHPTSLNFIWHETNPLARRYVVFEHNCLRLMCDTACELEHGAALTQLFARHDARMTVPLIVAMPAVHGGAKNGTRLLFCMHRQCGKRCQYLSTKQWSEKIVHYATMIMDGHGPKCDRLMFGRRAILELRDTHDDIMCGPSFQLQSVDQSTTSIVESMMSGHSDHAKVRNMKRTCTTHRKGQTIRLTMFESTLLSAID